MTLLPYGCSTYSKGWPAFGHDFPLYITHADGWRAFDEQGNDYADFIGSLGGCILGQRNPTVDLAIRNQLSCGTTFSLGSRIELEAAERVLAHFPNLSMLQWGVNGSDATTGACRLVRVVTDNPIIVMFDDGYHGFHDWCLADTVRGNGIPSNEHEEDYALARLKDLDDFKEWTEQRPWLTRNKIAGIIVEPDLHSDRLKFIREWCTKHGALMICDEVMTWQRYPEWTASAHYGVTPDLWCLGKSLANGMPCSAIVGAKDILQRFAPSSKKPNAFFSMTSGGHPLSMAAVVATLDVMEKEDGPRKLWDRAVKLHPLLQRWQSPNGFSVGEPPWNRITWKHPAHAQAWRKLMAKHGVLIYAAHNLSLAHDNNAMTRLLTAWATTVDELPKTLDELPDSGENEPSVMRR
jgi:glutamate-1-semialdehyde 2,1-aminomutase